MYVCMYVYMYIKKYVYMYICICIYIYICISIYRAALNRMNRVNGMKTVP